MSINEKTDALQQTIGYTFSERGLLIEALSHSSYVNELRCGNRSCNERLEFLGDAVLELVSSDFLFRKYRGVNEGELSKHRASLVCEKALAACARRVQLGGCILLGHGEMMSRGYERDSILSDALEAVIGAIYLDGGFETAKDFIMRFVLEDDDTSHYTDYKTALQELVQSRPGAEVSYELVSCKGPEHDRIFTVRVLINGTEYGEGSGRNKKDAEQKAAAEAIKKWG